MNRRPSQSRSGFDSFSPQHTAHFKAAQPGDEFFEPKPRAQMADEDVYIALTHVPPADEELEGAYAGSLRGRLHLVLCGHYQGGLVRLPFIGALFIPSQNLPLYGLLPGQNTYYGLTKKGSTYLYVSPGLGGNDGLYPLPFFRFFNPPMVSLISLTTSSL